MNRIVVLGSNGFLGTALNENLSKTNLHVRYMIHTKNKKLKNNEFYGDILDQNILLKNLHDNDVVVNLVGQYDKNFSRFFDANLKGSFNLLETAKKKKNLKIIFASSINVYGENCKQNSKETDLPNPMTEYGIVKFLTEQLYEKYSKLFGLNVIILRFSNIYGKNKKTGLISNIVNSTPKKPALISNNGNQLRDFLHVDDAAKGIIRAIKTNSKNFDVFNIASGEQISPNHIIQLIQKQSKQKIYFKLYKQKLDERCISANPSKASRKLKFSPKIDLNNGLNLIFNNL